MRRVQNIMKRWSTDQLITGIETADWLKLLSKNGWRVDATYAHRLAWVSGWSVPASVMGRVEDARFGRELSSMAIDPEPLFVLGHWRSGTTHTHNLLGRVPQHTYPTVYQVVFPSAFLSTGGFLPQLTARFMDDTRTYDNVKHGWDEAAEDEIALAKLTGLSPYISFMFPEQMSKYEKYVDFQECTVAEREKWKQAFAYFIKKIMLQTGGKRVVVKSCTHTARVRMLLEMFPNAKFVYISRHPYEVFASTLHMRSHTDWENFFQVPEENWEQQRENQTLLLGQRIFDRYAEDRHLIPEENLVELKYHELVGNEMEAMEGIWRKFDLDDWDGAERVLGEYVAGLSGYKRNKLKIKAKQKESVQQYWASAFEHGGYSPDYDGL
ncbi:MAG: sulfotransferase [Alphaproteobacteria bacterium]|nr:sulfotransferase [Alphaproteobacteria bacterium]